MSTNKLLTLEEVRAALHETVTMPAVRSLVRTGRLASRRIGKRYYVAASDLESFLSQCPDNEGPRASGNDLTARGSSSTVAATSGPAIAAAAASALLKTP